ncbi:MAG: Cys-tRNA(Pro) deacylase [Acidimicrobiia bacterium]|nr:Cys-tRNA(Pro) deacylase [Acidimicrobiia bacterium]
MSTKAIQSLRGERIEHRVYSYDTRLDQTSGLTYGEAVAAELDIEPHRVFKTLVIMCDERPTVAIVPVGSLVDLKAVATATGAKKATMADPGDAERLTGYVVGGISPFGQRRTLPTLVDESVRSLESVFVSAGKRGLQVELSPTDLLAMTDASTAPIAT